MCVCLAPSGIPVEQSGPSLLSSDAVEQSCLSLVSSNHSRQTCFVVNSMQPERRSERRSEAAKETQTH